MTILCFIYHEFKKLYFCSIYSPKVIVFFPPEQFLLISVSYAILYFKTVCISKYLLIPLFKYLCFHYFAFPNIYMGNTHSFCDNFYVEKKNTHQSVLYWTGSIRQSVYTSFFCFFTQFWIRWQKWITLLIKIWGFWKSSGKISDLLF